MPYPTANLGTLLIKGVPPKEGRMRPPHRAAQPPQRVEAALKALP